MKISKKLPKPSINIKVMAVLFALIGIALLIFQLNPFGYNDLGYRQIVETPTGKKYVVFGNGLYTKFPGSKVTSYPNVITIANRGANTGSTVDGALIPIRFNDATEAVAQTVVRFRLPNIEEDMLLLHSEYINKEYLALKGLQPYTIECLKSSAQLMDSEIHYSGGRAQLSQDFQNQLSNGLYLLDIMEIAVKDTVTGEVKRIYENKVRVDETGLPIRKESDLKQFGLSIASATIENVDYEDKVDEKLSKKIEASTRESVSKQNLITAQQEELTAAAEGRRQLVEIEYKEKQIQTQQLVEAETSVRLAEKNREKQVISLEAAKLEAARIKELAEATAFKKKKIIEADGALEKKLDAYIQTQQMWAQAFENYTGDMVPQFQTGGSDGKGGNAGTAFMDLMSAKAAKDLTLDLNVNTK